MRKTQNQTTKTNPAPVVARDNRELILSLRLQITFLQTLLRQELLRKGTA